MLRFSPASIQRYDSAMTVSFDHSGVRQSVQIPLKAEGALILGAQDFATSLGSAAGINGALSMGAAGSKYFIVDTNNSRIKLYDGIPTVSFPPSAPIIIGQANAFGTTQNMGGRSAQSLSAPRKAIWCAGKLFVTDTGNHRVLVWNSIPTESGQPADMVLGQNDTVSGAANRGLAAPAADGLSTPSGLACHIVGTASMLFVADAGNHRVLVWNEISSLATGKPADQVIGQADFSSGLKNRTDTNTPAQDSLYQPAGIHVTGTTLFVADNTNNRILAFGLPANDSNLTINGNALFPLGQASFTAHSTGSSNMYGPKDVTSNGISLAVADYLQHRVLVWSTLPSAYSAPDFAVGQDSMASILLNNTAGNGLRDAKSLHFPYGVSYVGSQLHVADSWNSRIMVFNVTPNQDHPVANLIIGQTSAAHDVENSEATITNNQMASMRIYADSQRLVVPDGYRNRVLIWNSFPTANNQPPDVILGQADAASAAVNRNGTASCATMSSPSAVFWDGARLYVADEGNHRVLVWNAASIANGAAADLVLGQPDCATISLGSTADKLRAPRGVYVAGGSLFVSDQLNGRIQAFATNSLSTGQSAAFTLKWTTVECPATTLTMSNPEQVFSDGTKFYIPERGRNRISVFASIPTAATCPSYFLGQPDGSTSTANATVNGLGGGVFDGDGSFYMIDRGGNHRVEKWISSRVPDSTAVLPTPDAVWGASDVDSYDGLNQSRIYGGYGFRDAYTPALVGPLMVIPDRSGRVYIVPKI